MGKELIIFTSYDSMNGTDQTHASSVNSFFAFWRLEKAISAES